VSSTTASLDALTRPGAAPHQYYRLDIPQASSAAQADVFSFDGERAIGEPTCYVIRFTHPRHDLSRSEYLNKLATFIIQPPQAQWHEPEAERRVYGVTTGFALLSSNRDESTYEIVLESRMALLRNNPKCRFFLDKSDPDIIAQILRENGFDKLLADFELTLYRTYRKREFVMQWNEDDLAFITRLCRRSGIWYVCDEGKRCEKVRFGDDFTHYRRDPDLTVAWQPFSGLQSNGDESIDTLEMHATSVPARHTVRTFSTESLLEKPVDASHEIRDSTASGEVYVWGAPYLDADQANEEARLRGEAALAAQVEYRGTGNVLDLMPGGVLKLSNRELADAKHGLLTVHMTCSAARGKGYCVTFRAIPSDRLYRLPLLEHTWPRIQGVVTGRIATPGDYKDPYLDEQGRYIVDLHLDRDTRTPGLNSCPMRLAKPFAGEGQTGFHFGLVEGTVVTVGFLWGNPDLPYISQVLHTAQHTDPVVAGSPWGTRNTIRTRSNNTLEFDDRQGREHIKLATEHGKTQLNLGHTVDRDGQVRGEGLEARTDLRAKLRAALGVLISSDPQSKARGRQADMDPAIQQFEAVQARVQALADSAKASKAEVADVQAENRWLREELDGLKKSVIALSAPNGIGMVTPDRVMVSAGKDVSVAADEGFAVNAMKNIAMAAAERLSLFAAKMGIKIFSAFGPVQIQAQRDLLSLAADRDVTVSSVNGSVLMKAAKEFVFECGGAFIRIANGCITLGAPNDLLWEIGRFNRKEAAQMHLGAPAFAPAMFPFQVSCEAWRGAVSLAEETSPKAEADGAAVPAAPVARKAGTAKPQVRTVPETPVDSPDSPNADHTPEQEPKLPPSSDLGVPVKLEKAVFCSWGIPGFVRECADETETGRYMALDDFRQPWLDEVTKLQYPAGGTFPTAFELSYDERAKCLYATVRVKIIPVDLFASDATGKVLLGPDGQKQSVPYETTTHNLCVYYGVGKPVRGHVMEYRDGIGPRFDVEMKKRQVEAVLNSHKSSLILDGCSKGASCGCRVPVFFRVEFLISTKGVEVGNGKKIHKTVHLFPREQRADAGSWGEVTTRQRRDRTYVDQITDTNVAAHECGHLFNFPDEYWEYGGWVHRMYIHNNQLDFSVGAANRGKEAWQMSSARNIMGGGCSNPVPGAPDATPSASVDPYYLEYIRRHFSEITHKKWRVGYGDR
jgi:type VI secretion system secreted protein VgrG